MKKDIGIGCLANFLLVIAAVVLFGNETTQGVSFLIYLMLSSLPSVICRVVFTSDATSPWVRRLWGPVIGTLCFLAAWLLPLPREWINSESDGEPVRGHAVQPAAKNDPVAEKPEKVEDILSELDALTGLEGVKREVRKTVNLMKINAARKAQGLKVPPMSHHMVFTGNPGTGKTTVARLMARLYRALGVVRKGQLVEVDRSGLVGRYAGETGVKTAAACDAAKGGVLFVDEAYQLVSGDHDDYGREAIATLLKRMEDDRDDLVVIVAGYTDEMREFLNVNPGLASRFAKTIEFADYTAAELAKIFRGFARKNEFTLAADLDAGLDAALAKLTAKRDRMFGNARFVRRLFEEATARQSDRLAEAGTLEGPALTTLTLADLGLGERKVDVRAPKLEEVLAELDGLTGLRSVKDEIRRLVATVRANKMREEAGVGGAVTMSYNFVFTGNPGTGKTTVARILGRAFRALGVLERGNFVETDRSGLVAKYAGQTAAKTNKLIDSAIGGVLFIDEAYQLNQGENDQYGAEAVATLLKRMEDARGSLVVIIAGYDNEMKRFFNVNAGLASRFNRTVAFPDYSAAELGAIFRGLAKKAKYTLSPDAEKWLDGYISVVTKNRDTRFGNARWARNLFEKSVERQSVRLLGLASPETSELTTLRLKDIGISLKDPAASDED